MAALYCNDWRHLCGDSIKLVIKTQGQHRAVFPLASIEVSRTAAPAGKTDVSNGTVVLLTRCPI